MTEKQAGLTAIAMAYSRAYHATHDSPKIFDDFLAIELFSPEEQAQTDRDWANLLQYIDPDLAAANPKPADQLAWVVKLTNGPITLGRSRFAEDALEEAIRGGAAGQPGVHQYIILGAGFDTFAYRRRELEDRLQVFELDHPATQAIKRERVARACWEQPRNLHIIPVDFTKQGLADTLNDSPYQPDQPAFFSWLGVSFYLTREVVFDTLRAIVSTAAPGSQVVFDYLDTAAFDPTQSSKLMQLMQYMAVQLGEPMKAGFDPQTLAAELAPLGLRLVENLTPAESEARHFRGPHGYHAPQHFQLARATID